MAEVQTRKSIANVHFKEDIQKFKNSTNRKHSGQIKSEMAALQKYWNCFPFQYYRFDMYRKDCTLLLEEMKKYVPHYFLFNLFYPLSFKDYGIVCEDKLLSYALLKAYELKQPKLLFCFDTNSFFDAENTPVSTEQIGKLLHDSTAEKLFVKPRFGVGGKGIFIFKRTGNGYTDGQNNPLDANFFLKELKDGFYIVQEGLVQYEEINKVYPHSVNTFRVVTECISGEAKVLYSIIRMGSGGQQVDNASSGGMYIKIDSESGILANHAYTTNRSLFKQHPDTGFKFEGAQLPSWQKAKECALQAASKFREIRYLGWDVAITVEGPSIIEFNHHPGVGIVQDCYGGIRDDLKIVPDEWWYQSNYTLKKSLSKNYRRIRFKNEDRKKEDIFNFKF